MRVLDWLVTNKYTGSVIGVVGLSIYAIGSDIIPMIRRKR